MYEHVQMIANLYRRSGQLDVVREPRSARQYQRQLARGAESSPASAARSAERIGAARATESELLDAVTAAAAQADEHDARRVPRRGARAHPRRARRPRRAFLAAPGRAAGRRQRARRGRARAPPRRSWRARSRPSSAAAQTRRRRELSAHPVHAGPHAVRHPRHQRLPVRHRDVHVSGAGRSSPTSSSPTRSIAPPPRPSPRCSKRWRSTR